MEAHTNSNDDKQIINDLLSKHNLDLAVTVPDFNEEKQDFKRVFYWEDKPKYDGSEINNLQIIIRNSNEYQEVDFDFTKRMRPEQAAIIKSIMPKTFSFGRDGGGHNLYKVINIPDDAKGTTQIEFNGMLNELRADGSYSIFYGDLDKKARAAISNHQITEIEYNDLHNRFNYQNVLAALTILRGDGGDGINNFLTAVAGEFYTQKISEDITLKIFKKWHTIINRVDRWGESQKSIKGIYKTGKAGNIFSKNHPVAIEDRFKHQFRNIVKELIGKKVETKVPTKLVAYNIAQYMNLGIKPTQFIIERLIKENSITYISGPKGNGKTEFTLGILNALARGANFLNYTCPEPLPIVYVDGEMDPYDIIERSEPYIEKLGQLKDPNYFRIINHAQQKDETIPDIKTEIGQKLIEDQAKLSRKLTEKSPVVVLDNLRSLSNYKENDSDEYRLINAWLLKMRARKYSIIVIDHHGKAVGGGPRGTSTKTDNANTSLLINSVREKGNPFMVMKIAFDKARGLKPNETEEFEAVYDFAGGWTRQEARAPKGEDDLCRLMKVLYDDHDREEAAFQIGLDAQLASGELDAKSYATIKKNHKGNLTQRALAEKLNISVGKLNKILNEGIYQRWLDRLKEEDKKSHF